MRLVATRARAIDGVPVTEETWILAVSPLRLDDDKTLMWHPPQPVAFNLLEARRYRDRGVKARRSIMGNLIARSEGDQLSPQNSRAAVDCISDLSIGVLFSFTAIEALANHSIDQLDETATVEIERDAGTVTITRDDMIRRLRLEEKFNLTVPMLPDGEQIKGTVPWERYGHLKGLRDELIHIKMRGYAPDPDVASIYDRLIRGDSDEAVEDAIAVIGGARPGWLPEDVLAELAR